MLGRERASVSNVELGVRASTADVATDNRPLTDQEIQLVRRLLSDPFSFPLEFKTWLVSYLETSDLTLPISATMGLTKLLGISGAGSGALGILPAGLVFPFGGDTAPTGSKLCDGTAYSRTAEARLFAAISTKYGAPDGSSFNVPNLRRKVPVMLDTSQPEFNVLGKTGGEITHQISMGEMYPHDHGGGNHAHPVSDPPHDHPLQYTTGGPGGDTNVSFLTGTQRDGSQGNPFLTPASSGVQVQNSGNIIASQGSAVAHNNLQPYITLNYIIVA